MSPKHHIVLTLTSALTAFLGASASAQAMECYEVTSWNNPGWWAGETANLSPISCTSTPAGHSWLEVDLDYGVAYSDDLFLLISHLDAHASSPTLFEPLALFSHVDGNGLPVVMTDLLLCGGCSNEMPMTVDPPEPCGPVSYWHDNSAPTPWYDGANCYVEPFPSQSTPFVYDNNWYVEAEDGTTCPMGWYDGANCYIQGAPAGAFILNNAFYTLPAGGGTSCPAGSTYDGANCYWFSAPDDTDAFEWAGNWYTSALPECPMGWYDGANCYVGSPPANTTAFHWGQAFYYAL